MCGISGLLAKKEVELSLLRKMTDAIAHRGPDGDGHWINKEGNVGFGHRRLSIIDLSDAGSQPMHSADGRYTIVFNGEIYNYVELKNDLIKKGYSFHSDSDTEVLLVMYGVYGIDCLKELDGMFAFAIWDESEKILFCARDRFGEKPFFYHFQNGRLFAFASEMKSLWAAGVERSLNFKMVDRYFNDKYYLVNPFDLSETFFANIHRLEPSTYLLLNENCEIIKKGNYWSIDPTQNQSKIGFDEAVETFRDLFFTSIKRRLRSDVPVGSSLSGGLDSSSIVCGINELSKKDGLNQYTFSARFPGFIKDESKHIDAVLSKIGIQGFSTFPNEDEFLEELSKFMHHQEEPVAAANQYAQWEVMKLAKKEGVTVLLDGQGADETVTGYDHYFHHYFSDLAHHDSQNLANSIAAYNQLHNKSVSATDFLGSANEVNGLSQSNSIAEKILKYRPLKKAWYQLRASDAFFTPDFLSYVWPDRAKKYADEPTTLNQSLWNDTFLGGLETLLRYGDRNSMAFSREVRLPFLYHKLVEFLFSLPASYKINEGWSKFILRKSMEPYLPQSIAWRKDKIGYEPPQQNWFAKPYMKNLVAQSQQKLEKENILNKNRKTEDPSRQWQTVIIAQMIS